MESRSSNQAIMVRRGGGGIYSGCFRGFRGNTGQKNNAWLSIYGILQKVRKILERVMGVLTRK